MEYNVRFVYWLVRDHGNSLGAEVRKKDTQNYQIQGYDSFPCIFQQVARSEAFYGFVTRTVLSAPINKTNPLHAF